MMISPLPRIFYQPSARRVAPRLLGHWLLRRTPEGVCGGPIVEVEAYLHNDPAAHGFNGETPRNRMMFGTPGDAYVYFIYGNHFCVNAVCRPPGVAEAVLIRAIEPAFGIAWMRLNRAPAAASNLTNGPGKLCQALQIDRSLDGANLCEINSPLLIAKNPAAASIRKNFGPIVAGERIGISRAAELPLRFFLSKHPFVSRRTVSRKLL